MQSKVTIIESADPYVQRLNAILQAYDEKSENYRFATVVYNSKKEQKTTSAFGSGGGSFGSATKNAQCFPPLIWSSYQNLAPEGLEPAILTKDDIPKRVAKQKEILGQMQKKIEQMKERIEALKDEITFFKKDKKSGLKAIADNNLEILKLSMEQLQVKEVSALKSTQFSREEQELLDKLELIKSQINEPNKFNSQLNKLSLLQKFMDDSQENMDDKNSEPAFKDELYEILEVNGQSLAALGESIKSYQTFVKVMDKFIEQQRQNTL